MIETEDTEKRVRQKEFSVRYIDRPVDFLIRHNISPNQISFIGFFCSLLAAFLIGIGWIYYSMWVAWFVPFLIGLGGAFDLFDGEVARRTDKESKAGAFLDSNLDRLSDALFIIGLIYGGLVTFFLGYVLLFLVIMISYTRSRAENEGVKMKGVGYMERAERVVFLLFATLIEMWFYFISGFFLGEPIIIFVPFITQIPVTPVFLIAILAYVLLLIYTIAQRLVFTFKSLNRESN